MSKRKYGPKIKRSTSLYKRRKSTFRKSMEIIGIIVLVVGLGTVGYAAGKPILGYIMGDREKVQTQGWTPPPTEQTQEVLPEVTTMPPVEEIPVGDGISGRAYYSNSAAIANKTALSGYISTAAANGYNYVVIDLKDSVGNVLYKSELPELQNAPFNKGELTLAEIFSVFEASEVEPIVRISTLQDKSSPSLLEGMSYRFSDNSYNWLDDRAENGGKLWADPTKERTQQYLSELTAEIRAAGFDNIILAYNIFPEMRPYDLSVLPSTVTDTQNRYSALTNIVNLCSDEESETLVEVDILDLMKQDGKFVGSAEALNGELTSAKVLAVYSNNDVGGATMPTNMSHILSGGLVERVEYFYEQAKANLGEEVEVIPCIENDGLSDTDLELAINTLTKMGYGIVMIK